MLKIHFFFIKDLSLFKGLILIILKELSSAEPTSTTKVSFINSSDAVA